jgi:hypothetical protein
MLYYIELMVVKQRGGGTLSVSGARGTTYNVVWDDFEESPYTQTAADEVTCQ